jgi:hypothetical protein
VIKKIFIIIAVLCIGKISFAREEIVPNFCAALSPPNDLLLNHFTKIKLKKQCVQNFFASPFLQKPRFQIGCHYSIPSTWAESINYPKLFQVGLILTTTQNRMCPLLHYRNFEKVTLQGSCLIDGIQWKTLQINRVKRLLQRTQGSSPSSSPDFVPPISRLEISLYQIEERFFIPLIQRSFSLK